MTEDASIPRALAVGLFHFRVFQKNRELGEWGNGEMEKYS
jgi:hypothetical protein